MKTILKILVIITLLFTKQFSIAQERIVMHFGFESGFNRSKKMREAINSYNSQSSVTELMPHMNYYYGYSMSIGAETRGAKDDAVSISAGYTWHLMPMLKSYNFVLLPRYMSWNFLCWSQRKGRRVWLINPVEFGRFTIKVNKEGLKPWAQPEVKPLAFNFFTPNLSYGFVLGKVDLMLTARYTIIPSVGQILGVGEILNKFRYTELGARLNLRIGGLK